MKSSFPRFYYLTVDPLNAAAAQQFAVDCGVSLELAEPRDLGRLEIESALLVLDWDYLPLDYRDRLLASSTFKVAAIHGFTISGSVAQFLLRRGTLCVKSMSSHLFHRLAAAAPAA